MSTYSYKCPSCGAGIAFKPEVGKFKCDYCLKSYTQEEIAQIYARQLAEDEAKAERAAQRAQQAEASGSETPTERLHGYHCNSCGATVTTNETTTATFCYYCHNPVIISDRFVGAFKPDQLIPFKFDKKTAEQKFLKWIGRKRYLPPNFTSASQLEKLTGMYLPFWYSDIDVDFRYQGRSTTTRSWTSGNYRYTETTYYQHVREGSIFLDDLFLNAYSKFDQDLIYGIGPFESTNLLNFSSAYLSGFFAEQYDLDRKRLQSTMDDLARDTSHRIVSGSVVKYGSPRTDLFETRQQQQDWLYTLLPIYILTYHFKGKTFVYALNGQTGQPYGEVPINKGKLLRDVIIVALLIIILGLLGGYFIW